MSADPSITMKRAPKALPALVVFLFAVRLSAQGTAEAQAVQHFQAAREAERAHDLPAAIKEYQSALKLKPDVAEAWTNLGLDDYVMKNDDDAIAAFQQALRRKPDLPPANLFLGMAYLRTNQYQKAIAPLKKAIALNPKELKAYINLSVAYLEVGREEESAAVLEKANEVFPHNTEILYNMGRIYTRLMEKSYQAMAQIDSDSYRFHEVLGDSYELRRDYPHAQSEYLEAIKKSPDPYLPGLHYALGTSYWMEGKWDLAAAQFQQELQIAPENYMVTWKLGNTCLFQRKYDEARVYLEKALKQKPDLDQANRDMGKLCLHVGQPEQALVYLQKVEQRDPDEASVHYLMAQAYRKLGKEDELKNQLDLFQKLTKLNADRAVKHPDVETLSGIESNKERPAEEESLDDLK